MSAENYAWTKSYHDAVYGSLDGLGARIVHAEELLSRRATELQATKERHFLIERAWLHEAREHLRRVKLSMPLPCSSNFPAARDNFSTNDQSMV
jgi:hypothetical protein